tara:strand:+ start:591 stop:839 length:249 start_codon:yes stop_codon:yes gene_type:complete
MVAAHHNKRRENMRDLNFLCMGRANIVDDDLLNIDLELGGEITTLLQEVQFLRDRDESLIDEIIALNDELETIRSVVKGDER